MPKKVDHAQRRRTIAEALWQVVIRDGLDQVSLRSVAAEADISMGMVQHYFASKDDLLVFALDSLTEQVSRRIGVALAETATAPERVRAVLVQTLPLDDERRVEALCGIAFLARAPVNARIAEYFRTSYGEGHRYLTEQLALAGVAAPERQAHLLFALADGLTTHALAGHHTPQTALAVLDDHLDRLFPSG